MTLIGAVLTGFVPMTLQANRRALIVRSMGLLVTGMLLSGRSKADKPRIKYSNPVAYAYAKKYCGQESNACGVFIKGEQGSDCAHFIAHCLEAGGISIKNTDPATKFCPRGLAVRNVVLVDALRRHATRYANVHEIDLTDAIVGDIGFLRLERPRHAFMVCKNAPSPISVPAVWAHSTSRCCEDLDTVWRQFFATAFRLEDG